MIITVVGLGLIGGSFGKSLIELSEDYHIIGSDASSAHEEKALTLGLVHECLPLDDALTRSDLILLAVPVDKIPKMLNYILNRIDDHQLVMDFGSTKHLIAEEVIDHPRRKNYLSAHPMAGTENTGPAAAFSGLYKDKVLIICDKELTDEKLFAKAMAIFNLLAFDITFMDSESHDHHIAYVSHLSHVSSFMLGLTVLDEDKEEKNILNMAGSGFRSTVRLAMSSPDMWEPIFLQNKENINKALEEYIRYLEKFRSALNADNGKQLYDMMARANKIRKTLQTPDI